MGFCLEALGTLKTFDPPPPTSIIHQCAAGGHFHVPIYYNLDWEGIQKLVDEKRIFLPDSNIHGGMYKSDALQVHVITFQDNQRKIEPKEGGGGGGWHKFKEVI